MAAKKKARTAKQKAASRRNIKKAQSANRGGKRKGRKRNPIRVAAVNPKPKSKARKRPSKAGYTQGKAKVRRRKLNPGGRMQLFGDLKVGAYDIGAGGGLLVAKMGSHLAAKHLAKAKAGKKETLFTKGARVLGAFFAPRLLGMGLNMGPASWRRAAWGAFRMAKPAAALKLYEEVIVPAIPEGKFKTKLGEWGLRGTMPAPLNGYIIDAETGMTYELDGVEAYPAGYLPLPDEEVFDGLDDLSDEELEEVIEGAYYDDDEEEDWYAEAA